MVSKATVVSKDVVATMELKITVVTVLGHKRQEVTGRQK
jgi:hypothetical protein